MNNSVGFLNINKPPGMSSHNVVAFVRHLLPRGLKVGHLGTLDPGACGVLPVAVGWATRTIQYFPPNRKAYRAEVTLGIETDTLDAHGQITRHSAIPELQIDKVEELCRSFEGEQLQVPPQISALHVDGQRAYMLSRSGCDFELPPRPVTLHKVQLCRLEKDKILLDIECSAGTYIRSLARDFGKALGACAHLSFLLRTQSGIFKLKDAYTIEDLRVRGIGACLWPVDKVLKSSLGRFCKIKGQLFQGGQEFSEIYDEQGESIDTNSLNLGDNFVVYNFYNNEFIGVGVVAESNTDSSKSLRLERLYLKGV